jgi:formylglycine-generating enzyme required for sulfatase activity
MVKLDGGAFLMGTDFAQGFSEDGEGPVREVTLDAFYVDVYPVTNRRFGEFVRATGYRTEAEGFGWSFVFHAHAGGG